VWDACICFGGWDSTIHVLLYVNYFSETIWWLLLPFCDNRKEVWHIQTRQNTFHSTIEDNIFHSLDDVKDYAHKNHNLALQWDGKRQDYSLERNDNLLLATFGWSAIWALASTANYVHAYIPKPIDPPRGFQNQQKTGDQVCFICQMHGPEPGLVLLHSHLEWQEEVMVEDFGKRMSYGRRNAFLEWMKHVIIFATAFHYLGCILKGILIMFFAFSWILRQKEKGPVGWKASTFTLLVFVHGLCKMKDGKLLHILSSSFFKSVKNISFEEVQAKRMGRALQWLTVQMSCFKIVCNQ